MHPRSSICGLLSIGALLLSPLRAQTHKVDAPEKVTRALAVYEWTGDLDHPTAARLIPVSLFIDGHLEDAGIYLAQPIPFALQTGDVYSIEHAGQTIGTFELDSALNIVTRRSTDDDNALGAWYGYGRFLTPAEEAKATPPQASTISLTITNDTDDAPPVLRHRNPTKPEKHIKQPGYVTPPTTPLNDDPNRPILHRGIPANENTTPQLTTLPPNLHQAAAISDAINRTPQTFTRPWATSTERAQTLRALEALARPHLTSYIIFNKLTPTTITIPTTGPTFASTPKPIPTTKAGAPGPDSGTRVLAQPPSFALTNEQLSAYTLSDGDLPTFIYTAESPITDNGPIYLTLVAQRQSSGELHLALLSITDATHLDRTPWLRPIDAVDPEASHRASLLFELRAQTTRQFALYSLTTAKAEQTFLTGPIE